MSPELGSEEEKISTPEANKENLDAFGVQPGEPIPEESKESKEEQIPVQTEQEEEIRPKIPSSEKPKVFDPEMLENVPQSVDDAAEENGLIGAGEQ